jgi:hypothetical protein
VLLCYIHCLRIIKIVSNIEDDKGWLMFAEDLLFFLIFLNPQGSRPEVPTFLFGRSASSVLHYFFVPSDKYTFHNAPRV